MASDLPPPSQGNALADPPEETATVAPVLVRPCCSKGQRARETEAASSYPPAQQQRVADGDSAGVNGKMVTGPEQDQYLNSPGGSFPFEKSSQHSGWYPVAVFQLSPP